MLEYEALIGSANPASDGFVVQVVSSGGLWLWVSHYMNGQGQPKSKFLEPTWNLTLIGNLEFGLKLFNRVKNNCILFYL